MNTLSIENLSMILNIELGEMLIKATAIDKKYNLGVIDFDNLERVQYDVIRSALDTDYMVSVIRGEPSDRKYNYSRTPIYRDLVAWLSDYNLNEFSTADVKATLPNHLKKCGMQTVAAAMRALGYENKMVYLEKEGSNKKQGRRWYKYEPTVSFM